MRLPTVRLKHKTTGKIVVVNETDWAADLGRGRWRHYQRVGELHTGRVEDKLIVPERMDEADKSLHDAVKASVPDPVQESDVSIDNEQTEKVDKPAPRRRRRGGRTKISED